MSAELLGSAYAAFENAVAAVDEPGSWEPTGCRGWSVRDLVFHVTGDAQRALVALHTPAEAPADRDAVTYWRGWGRDPAADASNRRWTRVNGSMVTDWEQLRDLHRETSAAVRHAVAGADGEALIGTQGHVLTVDDLASTLAVEATVHHLDLSRHLPSLPGPAASGLAEVRRVVEALAEPFPPGMDDARVAVLGTGRAEPTLDEHVVLTSLLERLPVFS
ncbi:MAG: maleylpyruvate isomerase N-terminal domain-containing protein [Nocardioides sp.]